MGIRGRLILLVLGIVIAMVSIGTVDLYRVWQFNREQLNHSLKKRAELAAVAFEQWSNLQREPLSSFAELIENKPLRTVLTESKLSYLSRTRPRWLNLQIVDEKGKMILEYSKENGMPKSLIEDILKKLKETNKWILTADHTLENKHSVFTIANPTKDGGAVIVQIDGESVKELFDDIELAENSVVAIMNKDGRILYRRSSLETTMFSEILGTSLVKSLGTEKLSVAEIQSPYDGISRVYGLARTETSENVVIIGISSKRFYEPLRAQVYRQFEISLLIFIIAIAITLFLAHGILRSLKILKDTTYQFALGNRDVKAPTDVAGEIGELGKAFNSMAEQINEREDRLKELDQLKTEFVSSVSHELRTPLTTIKTLAHVLKAQEVTKDESEEYLDVIASECDREIILVTNILDVSMIESGKFKYETSEIDLENILSEIYTIELPAARFNGIEIKLNLTKNLPKVSANSEALYRIFRTLVENAIKYNTKDGKIEISTTVLEKVIEVNIKDSGYGIVEQDLPFIFDKFYRGSPKSNSTNGDMKTSGAGLGLFIAKKIIEQLEGDIMVKNGITDGTVFTVSLPIWEKEKNGKTTFNS